MENEKNNKQNDIISKAKESIYKFQKQFVKSTDINNNNNPSIKFNTDVINMTFNPRANYKKDNNVFDMSKEKEKKQNYFIKNNNDNKQLNL